MNPPTDPGTLAASPAQQTASATLSKFPLNSITPDGYKLLDEIGRGGMGIVYRGIQLAFDRPVALKYLHERFDPDSDTARKFLDEARITAQLQHPGIPPIYEISTLPDRRPYLAMKFVKGRSLDALIRSGASLNVASIFEAIAQALGYAHSRDVIHRDLKPHNVMVGAFGEVQLMDWGLAKLLTAVQSPEATPIPDGRTMIELNFDGGSSQRSEFGQIIGTPAYMAPEQARGMVDRIDRRSDVFGLGAILCAMLTGAAPYFSTDGVELVRNLASKGDLQPAFDRLDGCGAEPELIALAKQCLALDPEDRPADGYAVAAIVAELRASAEDRAKHAEIDQARITVFRSEARRRQRLVVWAAVCLAGVLLVGMIGTYFGWQVAQTEKTNALTAAAVADAERRTANSERTTALAERDRADRLSSQAASVLDAMTSDLTGESLATQRALTPEQKRFYDQALKYYEELSNSTDDRAESRDRIGTAAMRIGAIQHRLGRLPEARKAYEKAIAIYQELHQQQPTILKYESFLAVSLGRSANVASDLGDMPTALKNYERSLAIQKAIVQAHPGLNDGISALASAHGNFGNLLSDLGELDKAMIHYEDAMRLQKRLSDERPNETKYQSELATSYNNIGLILAAQNKLSDAIENYQRGLAIWEELSRTQPRVVGHRAQCANLRGNMANVYRQLQQGDKARTHYLESITLGNQLCQEFPNVPEYQIALAGTICNYSIFLRVTKQYELGIQFATKAISRLESVLTRTPSNDQARQFRSNCYYSRASLYQESGQFPNAIRDYHEVLKTASAQPSASILERRAACLRAVLEHGGREPAPHPRPASP